MWRGFVFSWCKIIFVMSDIGMDSDVDIGTLPMSEWQFSVWHICLRYRNNRCRCRMSDIADILDRYRCPPMLILIKIICISVQMSMLTCDNVGVNICSYYMHVHTTTIHTAGGMDERILTLMEPGPDRLPSTMVCSAWPPAWVASCVIEYYGFGNWPRMARPLWSM
jgi:hypothetical protein